MKRYFMPLVVALLGAFVTRLADAYLTFPQANTLVVLLRITTLFAFGLSLHDRGRGRNESWIKKLIISFVLFFFVLWDLGYVLFPTIKQVMLTLGIHGFVLYMIYIYLGYSFFD